MHSTLLTPRGPWAEESDVEEGVTAAGFPFLIKRHEMMGHLIGLVAIPPTHPCYGVDHHNLELKQCLG